MKSTIVPYNRPLSLLWDRANLRPLLTALGLGGIFVGLWMVIHFSTPNLSGIDGYFHIRFAQVMREQGLTPRFVWLPLTILNPTDYFDHHFLYHVLLIPFTTSDLIAGGKWAAIIFSSLAFLTGWLLLRGLSVPYAAVWALGFFAVSEAFLYRLSMVRVQAVSLVILLLALHVALQGKYRWLLLLAFTYTWLYDAFPLLLVVMLIYTAARWLFDRQFTTAPLLYTLGGIGLGLVTNPYFPNNVWFIVHHYLPKVVDLTGADTKVGGEWYPYETWALVKNSGGALVALAAGALALGLTNRRMSSSVATLFFTALFFGALLLKSRRFVEYYPAFALLFCAAAWSPLLDEWRHARPGLNRLLPLLLLVIIVPAVGLNLKLSRDNLAESTPYQRFAGASAWLKANSPPGSRVFQTDWDDFSRLFFYNTHNTYTLGLDPTYMQQYDPDLYQLWRDTTNGWGNIGPVIKDTFGAAYVITDLDHKGFLDKTEYEPYLREVYRDEFGVIFEVLAEPDPNKKSWYSTE